MLKTTCYCEECMEETEIGVSDEELEVAHCPLCGSEDIQLDKSEESE